MPLLTHEMPLLTQKYIKKFADAVASIFPMKDGQDIDEYFAQVRGSDLKLSQLAMMAAHLRNSLKDQEREQQQNKNAWIRSARLAFDPGCRAPCAVCGAYESLTQAHHVVPLSIQFELGLDEPLHCFEWLCPTHHTALHLIIDALIVNVQPKLEGVPPDERVELDKIALDFVNRWTKIPGWHTYKQQAV
jgi:hypothetical protein